LGDAFNHLTDLEMGELLVPEGPRGGGRWCSDIKSALQTATNKEALEMIASFLTLNAVPVFGEEDTGCMIYNKIIKMQLPNSPTVIGPCLKVEHPTYYPGLCIDFWENGLDNPFRKKMMLAVHRFLCWWKHGPSEDGKNLAHHTCNSHCCVNVEHLEWCSARDNNILPLRLRDKRKYQALQREREVDTGRFKRRRG